MSKLPNASLFKQAIVVIYDYTDDSDENVLAIELASLITTKEKLKELTEYLVLFSELPISFTSTQVLSTIKGWIEP